MRFCKVCGRAMTRDASSGSVVFQCYCGVREPGGPYDARLSGAVLGASETAAMYDSLIRAAPFDRTNQLVLRPCPDCGLDYMTQIRVGDAEVIVYKCKCGHEEGGGGGAPAEATRPPAGGPGRERPAEP
jgi:DNA-directed RNA polymerase subunit M/transcription elongation factor TFIIS